MNVFEFTTLRLRNRASGKTLIWIVLFMLIWVILIESVLRLDFVHGRLAPSRMGSRHSQLGEKLRMMEGVIAAEGSLDCVALGSSVVDNGLDPVAFSRAFQRATGQRITCFNFGIDAIPGATAGVLAEILVDDYRPGLLIYGLDARDFAVTRDDRDTMVVLDSPWIKYRAGHFNLEGWLYEYSYSWRYAAQLKQLLVFDYENAFWKPREELTALGYNALYEVDATVQMPPDPADDSFMVTYLSELLADFDVPPENLQGLNQLLSLNKNGVQVHVVMVPVAEGYYSFYGNGRPDYDSFVDQLEGITFRYNVPFLRPLPAGEIPADGWFDYMHVNATGAEVFSEWLGVELGATIAGKQ